METTKVYEVWFQILTEFERGFLIPKHLFTIAVVSVHRPPQLKAFQHALSSHDCSRNVYVKKNGFTLHRNPIAQSTDGARGKIGFSEGRHAWEIWWEGPLGTVAVIGIATKRASMQCQGYVALLGSDDQSWGWNLVDNNLLHNGEVNGNFPQCNNAPKYQVGAGATSECYCTLSRF